MNNEAFKAFEDTAKCVNPSAKVNLSRKHDLVSSVVKSHKDRHLKDDDSWYRLSEDDSLASGSAWLVFYWKTTRLMGHFEIVRSKKCKSNF